MPGIPLSAHRFFENAAGLVLKADPASFPQRAARDLQNVHFDRRLIVRRNGYTEMNAVAMSGSPKITGLYDYQRRAGSRIQLVYADNGVLAQGFASPVTIKSDFAAGTVPDFTTFLDKAIVANGVDLLHFFDGTQIFRMDGVPRGQLVKAHRGRIFVAGVADDPSGLYYGRSEQLSNFPALNKFTVGESADDGDRITGLATLYDALIIFKEDSIWALHGTDLDADSDTFNGVLRRVNADVGCLSFRSIQKIRNTLIFLGEDGVYAFDGLRVQLLSEAIDPLFSQLNPAGMRNAISADDRGLEQYLVSVGLESSTEQNLTLVLGYGQGASYWTKNVYANNPTAWAQVENVLDRKEVFFGIKTGKIMQHGIGHTDNGASFTAFWLGPWYHFNSPERQHRMRYLSPLAKHTGAVITMNLRYDFVPTVQVTKSLDTGDAASEWGTGLWGTMLWGGAAELATPRLDLKGNCRYASVEWRHTGAEPWEVSGWTIHERLKGSRRKLSPALD